MLVNISNPYSQESESGFTSRPSNNKNTTWPTILHVNIDTSVYIWDSCPFFHQHFLLPENPEVLALGHCCVLSVWKQLGIWWGRCVFPGPTHEPFNSPNMYCFLELNQYKLKVHTVSLAESFQVDDEVGLPVAGWDQPRTMHCAPSALSKPSLAPLFPGSHHLPARP